MKPDLRALFKQLAEQGWEVTLRRSQHYKLTAPDGACYFTGSTPSDVRGMRNLRADLKRMGADL